VRKRLTPVFLVVLAAGVAAQGRGTAEEAPQPAATFRSGTHLIEVDVRVYDRDRRFVTGLEAADFLVQEDGRPQPIETFDYVEAGEQVAALEPLGTWDGSGSVRRQPNGQVYLLVLDDLHTHPLRSETVRLAARRFVERSMGPDDRAAVVFTRGMPGAASHEVTNSRELLTRALDQFVGQRLPQPSGSTTRRPVYAPPGQERGPSLTQAWLPSSKDPNDEEGRTAVVMLRAVRNWVTWLSSLSTLRKSLVLFTEGLGSDTSDVFGNAHASLIEASIGDLIESARSSHVAIYPIDPSGLPTGAKDTIPTFLIPDEPFFSAAGSRARMTSWALASQTGGLALTNSNHFDAALDRIVTESRQYYLLAYRTTAEGGDPAMHRIDVRVDRPGLRVFARQSWKSCPAPC
jgi:VWFA-related protein